MCGCITAVGAGQFHHIQTAGCARCRHCRRCHHSNLSTVKSRHGRPIGADHIAVFALIGPSAGRCFGQTHIAAQTRQHVRTGLTQTALGRCFAGHQGKSRVEGLGLEDDQTLRAAGRHLGCVCSLHHLQQLCRDVAQGLCCAGFGTIVFAIDLQVIGHHRVHHIGLGNALERDHIAHGITAVQPQRIGLRLLDARFLRAGDLQACRTHAHLNARKAFAARLGCKNQSTAIGRHLHWAGRQTVELLTEFERHIGQSLVLAQRGSPLLEVRVHHAVLNPWQTVHPDGDHITRLDLAGQSQHRQITQTL